MSFNFPASKSLQVAHLSTAHSSQKPLQDVCGAGLGAAGSPGLSRSKFPRHLAALQVLPFLFFQKETTYAHPGEIQYLQDEQMHFSPCAKNSLQSRGYSTSLLRVATQPQPRRIFSRFPIASSPLLTSKRSVMLSLSSRTHWPWCKIPISLQKKLKN